MVAALAIVITGGGASAQRQAGQTADANSGPALVRRIPSLEQEIEVNYRDASLHRTLGQAYAAKFTEEAGRDPQTLLTAFGEYLVSL
jgi:hypothetical protein